MEGNNNENKAKRIRKKKKWKIFKTALIAVLLIGSAVAGNRAAAVRWELHESFSLTKQDTTPIIENVDREALESGVVIEQSKEVTNILLIGADKRDSWKDTGRSDVCIIATIDRKHKQLKLTSLMRDMLIDIPGYGPNKFNAAYFNGGIELLYKTILQRFGIKVDGYALVDFSAFKKVINTLGGVNINLTEEEHSILMNRYHRTSVLDLKPGKNKMNGTQALAYCRLRQDIYSDFGRTGRQRYVLEQIFKKMKKKPVSKWYDVLKAVLPYVTTDLSEDKILDYMQDVIFMGTTEIEQFRLPVSGTFYDSYHGTDRVLAISDLEKNREELKKFIFDKVEPQEDK